MKNFAVIGDPIDHSLSPLLHNAINNQMGFNAYYEKILVKSDTLSSFIHNKKIASFNVTIPHKQTVIPFLDGIDDAARKIGAVNCIHNNVGYNTDWIGFLYSMKENKVTVRDKDCLIIGSGGAAKAVAYGLISGGANSIAVKNRTKLHSNQFIEWVRSISPRLISNKIPHLIINCTPIGMWPKISESPRLETLEEQTLIDTIYNPLETEWIKLNKRKVNKVVGGLDMFIAQGLASADIWYGDNISKKIDLEPIKKELKSKLC
tara:strand:+ start:86369 stop:87154 length:786 start_codon:yes stop_codon:yes gene_type:complete